MKIKRLLLVVIFCFGVLAIIDNVVAKTITVGNHSYIELEHKEKAVELKRKEEIEKQRGYLIKKFTPNLIYIRITKDSREYRYGYILAEVVKELSEEYKIIDITGIVDSLEYFWGRISVTNEFLLIVEPKQ